MCDEPATLRRAWRLLSIGTWVGLMAVVLGVVHPSPTIACGCPEQAREARAIHEVVAAVDPVWTIHWQAKTSEPGGQFRLYGGNDAASLQLVDIQQAAPGPGGYRFRHAATALAWSFYQLRYVTSGGRELVLANLWVHQIGLRDAPGPAGQLPSAGGKALSEIVSTLYLASRSTALPVDARLAEAQRPEPEVPPPRATG